MESDSIANNNNNYYYNYYNYHNNNYYLHQKAAENVHAQKHKYTNTAQS